MIGIHSDGPGLASAVYVLATTDFLHMEHAASLKGLLRPFKDKGQFDRFAVQCNALREDLIRLAQRRVFMPARSHPFNLLPVQLGMQSTATGTRFLRWRTVDRSAMGVWLWREMIRSEDTPKSLLPKLLVLEQQRIALNMQISLVHTIAREAALCAEKMQEASETYRSRVVAEMAVRTAP
jgi:hypothetical protein